MTWLGIGILALVTVQRLTELILANRNTRRLLALGAKEFGRGHYPAMIALHVAWLGSVWLIAPGRAVNLWLLALYLIVQLGRVWAVASLGERWTTRIIVLPGAPLIRLDRRQARLPEAIAELTAANGGDPPLAGA